MEYFWELMFNLLFIDLFIENSIIKYKILKLNIILKFNLI